MKLAEKNELSDQLELAKRAAQKMLGHVSRAEQVLKDLKTEV